MSAGFHRLGSKARAMGYSASIVPTRSDDKRTPPAPGHDDAMRPTRLGYEAPVPAADFQPGPAKMTREEARGKGFTGNTCSNCGSSEMQIAGHCEVCSACGTTTGCS